MHLSCMYIIEESKCTLFCDRFPHIEQTHKQIMHISNTIISVCTSIRAFVSFLSGFLPHIESSFGIATRRTGTQNRRDVARLSLTSRVLEVGEKFIRLCNYTRHKH